jgi:peptidoglycan/LPS O-acetylase OafA/YrhL
MIAADSKRNDIQVLRALAVLLVLFYHAGADWLPRGYLGVDVFFVISGYLITRMIVVDVDAGRFSFVRFYARRAKRLLPAAYCTFAFTAALAVFFLTGAEYRDFLKQLVGAVTFTANMVLLSQTGYFEGAADLKPLLHVWSLSLEEQYYLVLPLLLVLLGTRWRVRGAAILFALSLAAYFVLVRLSPDAAFYLLPTRAWELLMGSLCAIAVKGDAVGSRLAPPVALATLLVVPTLPRAMLAPGIDAVLVTMATAALIVTHWKWLESGPIAKRLGIVGDWSYSIYLVHWPLFAFAANGYLGHGIPAPVRYGLAALSIVLAWLQYRYVETPFRRWTPDVRRIASTAVAASILLLSPLGIYLTTLDSDAALSRKYSELRRVNYGLSASCDYTDRFHEKAECMTSSEPRYAIWGDSFAMALVPGLAQSAIGRSGLVQITRSACAPVRGMTFIVPGHSSYNAAWSKSCIDYNETVHAYLSKKRSVDTVIIGSSFNLFSDYMRHYRDGRLETPDRDATVRDFVATIRELRAIGKRVVIVAPPPAEHFNIAICLERLGRGAWILGRDDCDIPEQAYRAAYADRIALIERIRDAADVEVLWPHDELCGERVCRSRLNGKFVYRDAAHLSHEGSIEFAKVFDLARKIDRVAR